MRVRSMRDWKISGLIIQARKISFLMRMSIEEKGVAFRLY
jgi:hypothetical protein